MKLAESRFWDQDFIDFFLLSRIGGEWQIVAKSFDHVGATYSVACSSQSMMMQAETGGGAASGVTVSDRGGSPADH